MDHTNDISRALIWDNALEDNITRIRKNQTLTWSWGMDKEETYKKNILDKKFASAKTYNPTDFSYTFNSMGVRCDELIPKDVKFLYAGCSFTEGEGLPVEHVWPSFVNGFIKTEYKDKFGYHNIGRGGLSGDGITRRVFQAIEVLKLRPKMLTVLFPSIFRSEFYYKNFPHPQMYAPTDYVPSFIPSNLTKEQRFFFENHEQNVRVINSINQLYANAILIDALCGKYGIEFRFDCWQGVVPVNQLNNEDIEFFPKKYIVRDMSWGGSGLQMVDMKGLIDDLLPESLKDKYLKIGFSGESILKDKPFEHTVARDYAHPGPNCQWDFATKAFQKLKPDLDKIYDQSNKHKGPISI